MEDQQVVCTAKITKFVSNKALMRHLLWSMANIAFLRPHRAAYQWGQLSKVHCLDEFNRVGYRAPCHFTYFGDVNNKSRTLFQLSEI